MAIAVAHELSIFIVTSIHFATGLVSQLKSQLPAILRKLWHWLWLENGSVNSITRVAKLSILREALRKS